MAALQADELFACLDRHGVQYVLIGGLAAVLHGSPLLTLDVDICPSRTRANLARLAAALTDLDARIRTPDEADGVTFPRDAAFLEGLPLLNLVTRTFLFAKAIIDLCPKQYVDDASRTIWRQLIRAAPGSSAMLDEADEASSAADFVYRMKVVLREMKESQRWLRFIADCKLQHHERLGALLDEARQLCAIFATIVRNTRRRIETQGTRTRREK